MILDSLQHADRYAALHPGFAQAFAFLRSQRPADFEPGRVPIDGDRLFALPQLVPVRRRDQALLEAHQRYIDIQYVVSGHEEMGWRPRLSCIQPRDAFDAQTDVQFFDDLPDTWVSVLPGTFTVFFPEDAHAPSVASAPVQKVVVKIAIASAW
ncbi:MAG: YhcH/YjgK/YiaL family protein [Verrucomicrobia bacterium]|nr:YhcH/YjgK/YiaL family protein [Verrucomicrobiota bacterium]